ncbi:MAG TPA: CoB--CoM heterodisulfide reductase iron-sulfur subunit A family protein [Candidatus Krumholzibacteriaceae bacterium]|nr:CoB--CoM heterodisulfide reductase iron-sulfur subunit A family protein [Candidatus Krumholzibacteriaceae bacterium]
MSEEPRIGVFVCHCGINIGGYVDVPEVVKYSMTLPDVVYAEPNLYTCSSDGLQKIKEAIENHRLNRVVVASCTPRTHEPLFQGACEEAGLNKYIFEMANIRDQCSWVHMHEPEKATQKAKDLVRMAVAKARLLTPEEEPEIDIHPTGLVIGGGVSGMTAALSLMNQGFKVHLVEKEDKLGGALNELGTLFPTNVKASEVLKPLINGVEESPDIVVHLNSTVKEVKGFIGNFEAEIESKEGSELFEVGTVIVATGADYLDPVGLFGYSEVQGVVTQLELEQKMKEGSLGDVKSVVMVQCAGSRIEERPYCSRICCTEAMKNASLLKEEDSDRDIYVLYRDLQTYGIEYTEMEWDAKRKGVKLVKYDKARPPVVTEGERGPVVKVWASLLNEELTIKPDLVVLSAPLVPNPDNKTLSQLLKVPLNRDGFFMEAHVKLRPVDFATDGIFVCGTAHSPKEVAESISQAKGAASRAGIPMAKGRLKTAAITSVVDEDKCCGCGTCIEMCAYNAITKNERGLAQVTAAVCKGCGVCGASCPERAITMRHFTDEELEAQGLAAIKEA